MQGAGLQHLVIAGLLQEALNRAALGRAYVDAVPCGLGPGAREPQPAHTRADRQLHGIKGKQDIAGEHYDAALETLGQATEGHHQLVKERGPRTTGEQLPGQPGEHLSEGRAVRDALAVTAGVDQQDAQGIPLQGDSHPAQAG